MGKIEIDLQNLSALEVEIKLRESRKMTLQSELEKVSAEINSMQDRNNKEIALAKQQCEDECQEKVVKAANILREAEQKLKTAEQRERDSAVIEGQMKRLDEKNKASAETQKSADNALALALEKAHKADLLIEQYTKRLDELGEKKEGKKEEKKK